MPEAEEVAATCSDEAKLGRTRRVEGKRESCSTVVARVVCFYVVVFTAIVC